LTCSALWSRLVIDGPSRTDPTVVLHIRRNAGTVKKSDFRLIGEEGGSELDLHGKTVDEALPLMDTFIHRAFTSGYFTVRIVHGKGSGVLRREVDRYLSGHPLVHAHSLADRYHGGDGATVVTLSE
jgi:dsDNA-specific endonuclease/ATPase MutS2